MCRGRAAGPFRSPGAPSATRSRCGTEDLDRPSPRVPVPAAGYTRIGRNAQRGSSARPRARGQRHERSFLALIKRRAHGAIAPWASRACLPSLAIKDQGEEQTMPKVSATTAAKVDDFGVAIDRNDELDGYAFSFVTINEGHSLAPMLSGLP